MNNIYILDTSVFICNPYAFKSFNDCQIIIPITVLEELDKLKKHPSDVGRHAKLTIKYLDELTNNCNSNIEFKVNTCNVRIDASSDMIYNGDDASYGDNKILSCALRTKAANGNSIIKLVSKDINLRVKAKVCGLQAEDYDIAVNTEELYNGFQVINDVRTGKKLSEKQVINYDARKYNLFPNEFVLFTDKHGNGISVGRRIKNTIKLVVDKNPWGLKARGKEQLFAIDLLMDSSVPLVSLAGIAGGGKTLCSIAASLELVLNKRMYENFTIYRPIQTVGPEIGFLPGTVEEKIAPFYGPVNDAFSFLFSDKSRKKDNWKTILHQYIDAGIIKQEAIAFIRGRSIANSLVFIDEAQNLSKEEVKTILTRVGENSKIIFSGDIEQIDSPQLDASSNGLTYLIEKFKEYEVAGHVNLNKGERSTLASLAAHIL